MAEETTEAGATRGTAKQRRRAAGLSPRIDAAVSHFVRRHPPAGSASVRPARPARRTPPGGHNP